MAHFKAIFEENKFWIKSFKRKMNKKEKNERSANFFPCILV
ncbi:hypothetical protein [Leptospira alexanderi]|nr:hypothetical protein [Leptospira alexanderi]